MMVYNVGQVYTGRVINIYNEDIVIELTEGVVGSLKGDAALLAGVAVGDSMQVCVEKIENNVLVFALPAQAPAQESAAPKAIIPTSTWGQWNKQPIGHAQAVSLISALQDTLARTNQKFVDARTVFGEEKRKSQQIYEDITEQARANCNTACDNFERQCNADVATTRARARVLAGTVGALEALLKSLDKDAAAGAKTAAIDGLARSKTLEQKYKTAIQNKAAAMIVLKSCQQAQAERTRNEILDHARKEQLAREEQVERTLQGAMVALEIALKKEVETGMHKTMLHAYAQSVKSSRVNANYYECATSVPEYIMLGEVETRINVNTQDENLVKQLVAQQAAEFGENAGDFYSVKVPYAQRLSDGISLMMCYPPSFRTSVQGKLQPLLLKLFMHFPAGKLEATMVDPLELGASFPDIPKIAEGPNSARIIDTKIWSKEHDIEVAMATLRQRLENMTQAFGDDKESRLKKEVVRVLAITDFPVGFNDAALKDLNAIVRNSRSLGVCVFICANEEELEKLKRKNGSLVTEITQNLVETKMVDEQLVFANTGKEPIYLHLDEMSDVFAQKNAIIATLRDGVDKTAGVIEPFHEMYPFDIYDSNNWFGGDHEEIAIPIGIKGAATVIKMVVGRGGGSTEHHALIAGQTGAGKSTLLHTLIMSTLVSYSPDEVQMYLLDFKEGVEFSAYTHYRLPSLRVVAMNSEREFGLNVLKELCAELETRSKHFTRYGVSDINAYVKRSDVPPVPKLLLIFDEVQELFRDRSDEGDSITAECLSCLNKLVMQGRAMGIHIILACQDFHNCAGLEAYFSQMAIRLAVKGSETGAASILSANNPGIKTLQNESAGAAIYNGGGGVESANNFFQISYITDEERLELLSRLDAYYTDPAVAPLYAAQRTRTLLTNAEEDIHNCFNQLILCGSESIQPLAKEADGYGLLMGQGFLKKKIFMPELRRQDRDNLLIVSNNEKMAFAMFELCAMSVLYEELHTNADKENALVYLVDLSTEEFAEEDCDFSFLGECFPQQIKVVKKEAVEALVSDLYDTLLGRAEGSVPDTERIFLMYFGIDRVRRLGTGKIYDDDNGGELTVLEKLQKIIGKGARYGINSIVWGESLQSVELMLSDRYDAMFDKRIAWGLDSDAMNILVAESNAKNLRGQTAVYMDIDKDIKNTHFRPYDVPAKIWVEAYANVYEEIIQE